MNKNCVLSTTATKKLKFNVKHMTTLFHKSQFPGSRMLFPQNSLLIECPLPAALSPITPTVCAEHFNQVVRLAFERTAGDGIRDAAVPATDGDIELEVDWDAQLIAVDDTAIVLSPLCENLVFPAGELITEGGDDNSTLFGSPVAVGKGNIQVTGRFRGLSSDTKRDLEQFISEGSVEGNLGIFLINEFGQIIGQDPTGLASNAAKPFPIANFFISDVDSQGFNTHNFNNFSFTLRGNWSDFFYIYNPDFDPISK